MYRLLMALPYPSRRCNRAHSHAAHHALSTALPLLRFRKSSEHQMSCEHNTHRALISCRSQTGCARGCSAIDTGAGQGIAPNLGLLVHPTMALSTPRSLVAPCQPRSYSAHRVSPVWADNEHLQPSSDRRVTAAPGTQRRKQSLVACLSAVGLLSNGF
jgi:hypothetical protein